MSGFVHSQALIKTPECWNEDFNFMVRWYALMECVVKSGGWVHLRWGMLKPSYNIGIGYIKDIYIYRNIMGYVGYRGFERLFTAFISCFQPKVFGPSHPFGRPLAPLRS